jgi:hypothetical protein
MFGKKTPPPPKTPLPLQILSVDYVIDGQLMDKLEEGLIRPWLMRVGNPSADGLRATLPLTEARIQPAGGLTAPSAQPAAPFNVWFQNIIAVLPGDAAGEQQVTAWAKDTVRKVAVPGVFYAGPYVVSGTAMTKDTDQNLSLGHLVAVLDATVHCAAANTRLPDFRSPAMLLATDRIFGYEPA